MNAKQYMHAYTCIAHTHTRLAATYSSAACFGYEALRKLLKEVVRAANGVSERRITNWQNVGNCNLTAVWLGSVYNRSLLQAENN